MPLLACWLCANALPSDNHQLLHVSSQDLTVHYNAGKAIYAGNVKSQQGSRKLNGDTLTIQQDNSGQVAHIVLTGDPANGQYTSQSGEPPTLAESKTMLFQPQKNLITFKGDAKITHTGNVFSGPVVTYDTQSQVLKTPDNGSHSNSIRIQPYNTLKQSEAHD